MLDLFDQPVIPGIKGQLDFIDAHEERSIIDRIGRLNLAPFRFGEWSGNRLTLSFGWAYDFQINGLRKSDPVPVWLRDIRDRAAAFAGLSDQEFEQVMIIRYDPGAGIGWHRDRPVYQSIMGVSLGERATMRFRRRDGSRWSRAELDLVPRSIYLMRDEAREDWEHGISPMVSGVRYSITMRSFSVQGRVNATAIDRRTLPRVASSRENI